MIFAIPGDARLPPRLPKSARPRNRRLSMHRHDLLGTAQESFRYRTRTVVAARVTERSTARGLAAERRGERGAINPRCRVSEIGAQIVEKGRRVMRAHPPVLRHRRGYFPGGIETARCPLVTHKQTPWDHPVPPPIRPSSDTPPESRAHLLVARDAVPIVNSCADLACRRRVSPHRHVGAPADAPAGTELPEVHAARAPRIASGSQVRRGARGVRCDFIKGS